MKRAWRIVSGLLAIVMVLGMNLTFSSCGKKTSGQFRVGMECAYAPFNWTQINDTNGAVAISGTQEYAGGYDVEMAKKIAEGLGKELVIVKLEWDGLAPALNSNMIDGIIAGMSPTEKRKKTIDFTDAYYRSDLVLIVRNDSKYASATSLADFAGAKVTAQQNTFHYTVLDQIPDGNIQPAMVDFPSMRVALQSGMIDAYVGERPEGISVIAANPDFKVIEFSEGEGFEASDDDVAVAVGIRKGDTKLQEEINKVLAGISEEERVSLMDQAVANQPVNQDTES